MLPGNCQCTPAAGGLAIIDIRRVPRSIRGMDGHDLRHLAFIDGSAPEFQEDIRRSVGASCERAALAAREAFALVPGLRAFSWLSPVLDRLLARAAAPVVARACADGAHALAGAAAELDASLRLCGRTDDLPGSALRQPARPVERTLLWFRRYGGRDEIVRAAGRFFAAHPGETLADGELDAWLDTAGVPDPDLLLYAGGPPGPQDVLLWQGSYAEIWHTPEPGPGFPAGDLRRAVADYYERQRRFGR
jgi:hypothetical protein